MVAVRPKQLASMWTRDGVRLDADLYYPDAQGEFPVLLMRQPYGRAIASTVVYAHPVWYAAHGYIVVIQDVRGRGSSEGEFDLFAHEMEDGFDTVQWAAALPGSTGDVGMYGFSYQGMTQLYAALQHPLALKTICPSMVGYDLYQDWAYEGGAFRYQLNLGWAIQLACETARRRGDTVAYHALYAASRSLPLHDPICVQSELLQRLDPDSFYHAWLAHPHPDEYWDRLSPQSRMASVDLPMLHIGGWFDPYLSGTLRLYREMGDRSAYPQHLLVGPWAHLPWGRRVGAMDYGSAASSPVDRLQIRWFDHFLKGHDTGLLTEPPVWLFELGRNDWHKLDQWPISTPRVWGLTSTGLASMGETEGHLVELTLADGTEPLPPAVDWLVHDPWRPVPNSGGHAAIPAGPVERSALDSRTDVLTYTSAPLTTPLRILGEAIAELHLSADSPSFDLCAVLSEVRSDGTVYPLAQGYARYDQREEAASPLRLVLQPCAALIEQGHALRLSLSGACFPAFAVNAGTGATSNSARLIDAGVITYQLSTGGVSPSVLRLPILKATD